MDHPIAFVFSFLLAIMAMVGSGTPIIKRLTLALEGHYEFKGDSLTKRSRVAGFFYFSVWGLFAVVTWSFFFDWYFSESLEYAITLLLLKIEIIVEILSELSDD